VNYNSILKILHGITCRQQTEQELRESEKQVQKLFSQLSTAQESERSGISRELYDGLGGNAGGPLAQDQHYK
jgi:signal transduction histidine kinase